MIASKRFKPAAKKYYSTFYRSDIDPPDIGLWRKNEKDKMSEAIDNYDANSCEPQ